ncbi:hypothetical protein KGF54_004282 [Candida jiufengensis]|uniref:uncharacterized protein n=1 Tax=Candida jiufengensis TaxID=497108 RepID=UPI00222491E6|nr:uncharacterized protein KGF54_004282 [Candida jiufengensis]KAI5951208.1 hypothetical protein KGF54_004282 [Candida jiufengensis]
MNYFNAAKQIGQLVNHEAKKHTGTKTYTDKDKNAIAQATQGESEQPLQVQIYSHNIRFDQKNLVDGEKPWSIRRNGVIDLIKQATSNPNLPSIIGLQEVLKNQLDDIVQGLGPDWTYFGVGRNDGSTSGEFSPILYNKQDWEPIFTKTFWLSETPSKPSKSWDAAMNRIVSNVILKNKKVPGKSINFFNTHFDHKGSKAREQSSLLIVKLMNEAPVGKNVLTGDLNSDPNAEGYKTLSNYLKESGTQAQNIQGERRTCTGFTGDGESIIDFIWTSSNVPILFHTTIDQTCDGCLCSDHRPVVAVVEI